MPQQLPAPARAIAEATTDAVTAVTERNATDFEAAAARLAAADPEHVRVVLGAVVRSALEDLHPDGVTGDELLELLRDSVRTASAWCEAIGPEGHVVVITGALGVHDPDEEPRITPAEVARHAPLFLARLLAVPGPPRRSLPEYLRTAFTDLAQAELNEMP